MTIPSPSLEHLLLAKIARLGVACELSASSVYDAKFGVKNHELKVLNVLSSGGALTLAELSLRAHVDKAWVSRSIDQLANRGLVTKRPNPQDARSKLVELSSPGAKLIEEVAPTMLEREAKLVVGLDRDHVCWLLDTLLYRLEQMRVHRK